MKYDDCAVERLEDRLLELFMKKSTPQKYSVVMFEAAETIRQLKKQASAPPNDPLTLEELREMDGEPVWVVELNGYPPHWGLVYWCRKNKRNIVYVTINNGASICAEAFMAAGGKIYRRKLEEENSGF